eukprot:Lithocolla_globosa_v1_NODE_1379_length_2620_cov_34.296686.p3 type:complete len:138 gc:universal NODE_1379_length_2620_cov_34.296686:520-933(+)
MIKMKKMTNLHLLSQILVLDCFPKSNCLNDEGVRESELKTRNHRVGLKNDNEQPKKSGRGRLRVKIIRIRKPRFRENGPLTKKLLLLIFVSLKGFLKKIAVQLRAILHGHFLPFLQTTARKKGSLETRSTEGYCSVG